VLVRVGRAAPAGFIAATYRQRAQDPNAGSVVVLRNP